MGCTAIHHFPRNTFYRGQQLPNTEASDLLTQQVFTLRNKPYKHVPMDHVLFATAKGWEQLTSTNGVRQPLRG